jgi:hypothetical protein
LAKPIRVIFLTFYFEALDAFDDIYKQMKVDSRFDPIVITMPRKLTGYEKFRDEELVSSYLDSLGINHERFQFKKNLKKISIVTLQKIWMIER